MKKLKLLEEVRTHWRMYIREGGIKEPLIEVGTLTQKGTYHWNMFLITGRYFISKYKNGSEILSRTLPRGMMLLLERA